jgi:type II secretory ATPase GspE/PulE/Tfp pilus assembly ATPase PilB-like protein
MQLSSCPLGLRGKNLAMGIPADIRPTVDAWISRALGDRASDLHVEPTAAGTEIRLRVDGLLHTVDILDADTGRAIVNRLMVMAQLLTYRLDVPQEGAASFNDIELRVAIMPTTHGLRAAVRLPAELLQPKTLSELGLPAKPQAAIAAFIASPSGMMIVTGPAGSGKTTTLYAILQEIQTKHPGQSIVTLEDPVEHDLPGITQIQVQPFGQLTYERALRSILRQDPQVLMLGEIRDAATASLAVQAALTGHKLFCTLHAPTAGGVIARLLEMGIEPYQISSALTGVLSQRLLRRREGDGYKGRVPAAEWVAIDSPLRRLVADRADSATIQQAYSQQEGYESLEASAQSLVAAGVTDVAEVQRVFG